MNGAPIVLHAEDDEDHAELVRRALKRLPNGCDLHQVGDGAEALAFLSRTGQFANPQRSPRPHVVLLDVRLPRLDGFELLEQVRAVASLRDLPVIMFSTSAAEGDLDRARELGATEYLVKPCDSLGFGELVETLQRYCDAAEAGAHERSA